MNIGLIFLAGVTLQVPPAESLYGPIFDDIGLDATIGNGNDGVTCEWWYGAEENDETEFQIRLLRCRARSQSIDCQYIVDRALTRAGKLVVDTRVPASLHCKARFDNTEKGNSWVVKHYPPRGSGHSRTSMNCITVKARFQ